MDIVIFIILTVAFTYWYHLDWSWVVAALRRPIPGSDPEVKPEERIRIQEVAGYPVAVYDSLKPNAFLPFFTALPRVSTAGLAMLKHDEINFVVQHELAHASLAQSMFQGLSYAVVLIMYLWWRTLGLDLWLQLLLAVLVAQRFLVIIHWIMEYWADSVAVRVSGRAAAAGAFKRLGEFEADKNNQIQRRILALIWDFHPSLQSRIRRFS